MKKWYYYTIYCFISIVITTDNDCMAQDPPSLRSGKTQTYDRLIKAEKELKEALNDGNQDDIADKYYVVGKRYMDLNDFPKGQMYFNKALQIRIKQKRPHEIGKIYQRQAEWMLYRDDLNLAYKYVHQAIFYFLQIPEKYQLIEAYRVLGSIHKEKLNNNNKADYKRVYDSDSVEYYYKKAAKIAEILDRPVDRAHVLLDLGNYLLELNKPHESLSVLYKAYDIYKKHNERYFQVIAALSITDKLMNAKKFNKAKSWIDTVLYYSNMVKDKEVLMSVYNMEMNYYVRIKDWEHALLAKDKYYFIKLKHLEEFKQSAVSGVNSLYLIKKREAELLLQKNELEKSIIDRNKKIQFLVNILYILSIFIVSCVCVLLYRRYDKYKKIGKQATSMLKEQSHRINNYLQSLSDLLALQFDKLSDPAAIEAVEESFLRIEAMSMVHKYVYKGNRFDSPDNKVNMNILIPDLMENTLRIYSYQHVNLLYKIENIYIQMDKAVTIALIINELTTNVCKHVVKYIKHPSVSINLFEDGEYIKLVFQDNGGGMIKHQQEGYGMTVIKLMIERLNGKFSFLNQEGLRFELEFKNIDKRIIKNGNL